MTKTLLTKNKMTGKTEVIYQRDLEMVDWGFHFSVDSEIEAYKAAYLYRDTPHGVMVEPSADAQRWWVTVFNDKAADWGIDGARKAA